MVENRLQVFLNEPNIVVRTLGDEVSLGSTVFCRFRERVEMAEFRDVGADPFNVEGGWGGGCGFEEGSFVAGRVNTNSSARKE